MLNKRPDALVARARRVFITIAITEDISLVKLRGGVWMLLLLLLPRGEIYRGRFPTVVRPSGLGLMLLLRGSLAADLSSIAGSAAC